jgi:hypothetical protein
MKNILPTILICTLFATSSLAKVETESSNQQEAREHLLELRRKGIYNFSSSYNVEDLSRAKSNQYKAAIDNGDLILLKSCAPLPKEPVIHGPSSQGTPTVKWTIEEYAAALVNLHCKEGYSNECTKRIRFLYELSQLPR